MSVNTNTMTYVTRTADGSPFHTPALRRPRVVPEAVVQRPVRAAPNVQRRGRAQRRVQIDLRPFDRRPRRVAGREVRRDGRAEGAGAMPGQQR